MKSTNSQQSLVSVITPTYNSEKFIGETIESVIGQTYKNWEMIVVDDGSTDKTESIVQFYMSKDTRIKYLPLGYNSGKPAVPRNHGIKHSQGDYIAFLDSDDLWLPEKLEKQIKLFQISNETAMVYTRYKTIEGDTISSRIFPKNGRCKSGNIFKSLYLRSFVACSSVMVKKSVLDQVGFFNTNPDLIAIEDTDLWLRIALKHVIKCTNNLPLILYRIHTKSISQGYIQNMRRSLIIKKRYKKYADNCLFWKSVVLTLAYNCRQKVMPQENDHKASNSLSL